MTGYVLVIAAIIMFCIIAERCSDKFGIPALILFMFVGMLFGSDGIVKISFDDFSQAETSCSIALVFIMFYGGFNTKWSAAKPVADKAIALSTLGVVITAGITTVLCNWILDLSLQESFLIGLLSFPHQMPQIMPMALAIVVILTVIARPIAVFLLMLPCKCSIRQCLLISWAGLRGASSCVFAIMAVAAGITMQQDLFHIVLW